LLSLVIQALSYFIYAFGSAWPHFVLAEVVSGVGFAFMAGSLDAWIVDRYQLAGYLDRTDFLFSRAEVSLNTAQILGAVITSWLIGFGLQLPFLLGGLVFLLALVVGWLLVEEQKPTGWSWALRL